MHDFTSYETDLARHAAALGHPVRVRLLRTLIRQGPTTVTELLKQLTLAQSTVSQHLAILREAGLIHGRRKGRHVHYSADAAAIRWMATLVGGLAASLPPR